MGYAGDAGIAAKCSSVLISQYPLTRNNGEQFEMLSVVFRYCCSVPLIASLPPPP